MSVYVERRLCMAYFWDKPFRMNGLGENDGLDRRGGSLGVLVNIGGVGYPLHSIRLYIYFNKDEQENQKTQSTQIKTLESYIYNIPHN